MIRRMFSWMVQAAVCLVLGLVSCAPPEKAPGRAEPVAEAKDGFFDSAGVRIHYVDQGEGEPVVVLHGYAMNLERMEDSGLIPALVEAGYRVLGVDCRGHGGSDKPHDPGEYGVEMAGDVVRLLDHLGLGKAHGVGYSMGGLIINKVREIHPERLYSATLGGSGWMKEGDTALGGMSGAEIAEALEKTGSFETMLRAFEKDRRPPPADEEFRARNQRMVEGNDLDALAAVMRSWHELAVPEASLRENAVPTIAIVGEHDPLKVQVDALVDVMRNLEVVIVQDAAHNALSEPEFSENLKRFLAKHGALEDEDGS